MKKRYGIDMKRIICVLLCIAMFLPFAGCQINEDRESKRHTENEEATINEENVADEKENDKYIALKKMIMKHISSMRICY